MDQSEVDNNIDLANRYIDVINKRDPNILDQILHPDFLVNQITETPSLRYSRHGATIDDIKKIVRRYLIAFPDLNLKIIDIVASDNRAIAYWVASMTHLGDFFGIKPTGKLIVLEGCFNFKMQDRKIIEYNVTFDTLKLFSDIGNAVIETGDDSRVQEYLSAIKDLGIDFLRD